jgi:alpha-mannosidase
MGLRNTYTQICTRGESRQDNPSLTANIPAMTTQPITLHLIANAHLDPVWLWPWQAGLDEVLNTCRTMCDLLDDYPDAVFTAGEAWRYAEIEAVDAGLFERIRGHVAAGRWALVGGWWIQPDCNFPSGFALERQIEAGKRFFLDRFGAFPAVAYNVDSFGHAASLPGYLRAAGQRFYVMMRPQEHEMALPARLFRWRGFEDGPEVLTFRIAGAYGTWGDLPTEDHLRHAASNLPDGVTHAMAFYGIGDHGGGPTARMISWLRDHREAFTGLRLEFSSPARFFAAVSEQLANVPLVTGELQQHAVGCYSVERGLKTRLRRAEHLVRQAELTAPDAPGLAEAWQHVAFNHFHDILGGTSIPSAYPALYDQLGTAATFADGLLQRDLRRRLPALPDDPRQRIVLRNASDLPFEGYVEHEPWLGWGWHTDLRLLDEHGETISSQMLQSEAANRQTITRLLFPIRLEPGELRAIRIVREATAVPSQITVRPSAIATAEAGVAPTAGTLSFGDQQFPLPRLDLIEDDTDNWSHGVDRFPEGPAESPVWNAPTLLDEGPLMGALLQTGRIGDSTLRAEWRVYAGQPFVELRLRVHWRAAKRLLKLAWILPDLGETREDGIPGAHLTRPNSGREVPMRDWTHLTSSWGPVAIVSPDIYAADATAHRVRLTLLRSPLLTYHIPFVAAPERATSSDQGVHDFLIRFYAGGDVTPEYLDEQAAMLHRPPLIADWTKGMERR